jgi:hypothetical protein
VSFCATTLGRSILGGGGTYLRTTTTWGLSFGTVGRENSGRLTNITMAWIATAMKNAIHLIPLSFAWAAAGYQNGAGSEGAGPALPTAIRRLQPPCGGRRFSGVFGGGACTCMTSGLSDPSRVQKAIPVPGRPILDVLDRAAVFEVSGDPYHGTADR